MDGGSVEYTAKRKKSKPRFISVKPEELEGFMKDVNEYKQILRSIGMYDLCQNWKQKRLIQRNEEKEERRRSKLSKAADKEKLGFIGFNIKQKQEKLYEFLGINNEQSVDHQDSEDNSDQHYVEYNKAYQKLHSQSDEEKERRLSEDDALLQSQTILQTKSFDEGSREEAEMSKDLMDNRKLVRNSDQLENEMNSIHQQKGSIFEALEKKKSSSSNLSKKKKANMVNKQLKKNQFRSQENSDVEGGGDQNYQYDLENLSSHLFDISASRLSDTNNRSTQNKSRQVQSRSEGEDEDGDSLAQETDNDQDYSLRQVIVEEMNENDSDHHEQVLDEDFEESEESIKVAKKKSKKPMKETRKQEKKRNKEKDLYRIQEDDEEQDSDQFIEIIEQKEKSRKKLKKH